MRSMSTKCIAACGETKSTNRTEASDSSGTSVAYYEIALGEVEDSCGCHVVDESFHLGFKTNDGVFQRAIDQKRLLVGRDGAQHVIGYLRWGYFWDDELPYIQMIRIIDRYRRNGVGRSLVGYLEAQLSEQGKTHLLSSTDETNEASIKFHERLGFQVCGRLDYPGEPQEILFLKNL
jgi:ribosomal protein S18 acetylase RimI-like enzyme